MRNTYLLGVNPKTNEIFTGEIEITTRNGYEEFTASFNVGEAFDIDTIDDGYINDYYNEVWDCYDATGKLELLYDGDRTKEDVFEEWKAYEDYNNIVDCSCTDYEMKIASGQTINFRSTCGGQHDIREDGYNDIIFTNKKGVEMLLNLWDNYHLKSIENNAVAKKSIEEVTELLKDFKEYEQGFEDFIKEHIQEV